MTIRSTIKDLALYALRRLNPTTPDGLSMVKVRLGPTKGRTMILNLDGRRGVVDFSYLTGYRQERAQTDLLRKIVRPGNTVWDIGIYRGFYTLVFSDAVGPGGKVFAFDIDGNNCRTVKEVVARNGITNATVVNAGLNNTTGYGKFISSRSSNSRLIGTFRGKLVQGGGAVLESGDSFQLTKLTTLDGLVEKYGAPDLIKIDIDGAELYALDRADDIFSNPDVVLAIESHNPSTDAKITDFLRRNRCNVFSVERMRLLEESELCRGTTISCRGRDPIGAIWGDARTGVAGPAPTQGSPPRPVGA